MRCSRVAATVASDPEFSPQLRLHAASWVFAVTGLLRQFIVPLIIVLLFSTRRSGMSPLFIPIALALLLIRALWHQWTYRYGFGPRGLVIREGLIFSNVRQIEYARIENIDTERSVLHRLLGVAQVSIRTSTGGKPEATLNVLDLQAVEDMRVRVFGETGRTEGTAAQTADAPLLHLPVAELVRYGLIDNRGMILVAAAGGVLYETGVFQIDQARVQRWLEATALPDVTAMSLTLQIGFATLAIIAALLAVRLLSVVVAILSLYDFTLVRHGSDLRARYGLLTRVALTIRVPRIQTVHQTESLLHRWFHRASLHVDLAGDGPADAEQQRSETRVRTRWLAPVCAPEQAASLISMVLPTVDFDQSFPWRPLAPKARSRLFWRSLRLWILLATVPAIYFLEQAAPFALLPGLAIAWLHARSFVKHTRWALGRDVLMLRRGWLTRELIIVPRDRIQSVALMSSWFDRRHGMASLFVDTAGSSAARSGARIPWLDRQSAEDLARALYESASARA